MSGVRVVVERGGGVGINFMQTQRSQNFKMVSLCVCRPTVTTLA